MKLAEDPELTKTELCWPCHSDHSLSKCSVSCPLVNLGFLSSHSVSAVKSDLSIVSSATTVEFKHNGGIGDGGGAVAPN